MKDCEQMTAPESSDDIELWMKILSGNATVAELASGDPESIKEALLLRTAIQRRVIRDFNAAINFAIETDEPQEFLRRWREGDWDCLRKEWPEFELPPMATALDVAEAEDDAQLRCAADELGIPAAFLDWGGEI